MSTLVASDNDIARAMVSGYKRTSSNIGTHLAFTCSLKIFYKKEVSQQVIQPSTSLAPGT